MATMKTSDQLMPILEDLVRSELKTFQWYLSQEVLVGFTAIAVSRLEDADRQDTLDLMVKKYTEDGAVTITRAILTKMGNIHLANKLKPDCEALSGTSKTTNSLPNSVEESQLW